jgi:ribosomal protein S18 acetylase RimI-like enzyme
MVSLMLVMRDLVPADLDVVRPWFSERETQRWLGDSRWPKQLLRLAADDPGRHALVAVEDGVVVAIVDAERYGDGRVSVALVVAPDRRRRGIATRLMHALAQRAELDGIKEVLVGVEEGNTASGCLVVAAGFRRSHGPDEEGSSTTHGRSAAHRRPIGRGARRAVRRNSGLGGCVCTEPCWAHVHRSP